MDKSVKRFIRNWFFLGMILIAVLAFWAGDWWSWKLIITIPLAIAGSASMVVPITGRSVMMAEDEQKKKVQT